MCKNEALQDWYSVRSHLLKISFKDYGCLCILFLVALLASLPMLANCGLSNYDFMFHFTASQSFAVEFWGGNPYPRWLASMNGGFGSPIFYFYGPVAYFFTSLFHPFAGSGTQACFPLGLGSLLALAGSGWTAYLWLRSNNTAYASLAGAGLYLLLPYHLSTDLYLRFAYAELWAFVWMPLALYFARSLAKESTRGQVGLACSLALLVGTHLPVFLIFAIVPFAYCLFLSEAPRRQQVLFRLLIAYLLTIGLSAVYWIPALANQDWVSMEEMKTSKLLYDNNFLVFPYLINPGGIQKLFAIQEFICLIIVSLAIAVVMFLGTSRMRIEAIFLGLVAFASVAMMLPISDLCWKALPMLQRIQFPSRFNAVLGVSLAGLVALAATAIIYRLGTPLAQVWHRRWKSLVFLLSVALLFMIQKGILSNPNWQGEGLALIRILRLMAATGVFVVFIPIPFRFSVDLLSGKSLLQLLITGLWLTTIFLISDQNYRMIFSPRIDPSLSPFAIGQLSAQEHFPAGIDPADRVPGALLHWSGQTPKASFLYHGGSVDVKHWRSRSIQLKVDTDKSDLLELHQFHFPGWTAREDLGDKIFPIERSPRGLLRVKLPAGRYEVNIDLNALVAEKLGWLISGISLVVTILICRSMRSIKSRHGLSASRMAPK